MTGFEEVWRWEKYVGRDRWLNYELLRDVDGGYHFWASLPGGSLGVFLYWPLQRPLFQWEPHMKRPNEMTSRELATIILAIHEGRKSNGVRHDPNHRLGQIIALCREAIQR